MSTRANRRRSRALPVNVKIAFGNDDENLNTELVDESPTIYSQQISDKNNENNNYFDRSFHKEFFTVYRTTVEVILEEDILSWATVTSELQDEASRRKFANTVNLHDVFAIEPIHTHWNWSLNINETVAGSTASTLTSSTSSKLSENSILRGFQLHSYQRLDDNILQEILIVFQSDDSNQIKRWFEFLSKIIDEYTPSRHIFVICNPYAGARHCRYTYNTRIKILLERAKYKISYAEIDDHYDANDVLKNFDGDFDSIDGLVIIGGDGSVINVINALIHYLAKENRIRLDMNNDLPSIPFPICIIPDGTTNIISHTIQGNIDYYTPILHLILNHRMKIDMSAIYDVDFNFVTANFNSGAGFPATVLKYFPRYSIHRPKTVIRKSFGKAASNKNLKPFQVEIRYIPASQTDVSTSRCFRGCPSCTPPESEKCDDQVKAYDDSHIVKMYQQKRSLSLISNGTNHRLSSAGKNFDKDKNWKIIHEEFLQVAVFTNASLWSFAPQGLAKFGHLADGLLDLVTIEPVTRKEFLRYVKRNGNSKNQYDLPFTRLIKAKEIEIELKTVLDPSLYEISNGDNGIESSQSDNSSIEDTSDNEIETSNFQKHQPRPPSAPITEDSLRNRQRRRRINQSIQESTSYTFQSSISMDAGIPPTKSRSSLQQQSENEIDPYASTTSLRRSGIFRFSKSKREKPTLPRPASARGRETDDEKSQSKSRKSIIGTLRPARSFLSLFTGGNTSSENSENKLTRSRQNSISSATGRRSSILSRSSSMIDNTKIIDRRMKKPCMWNLDFTPYNSHMIRIKCVYRYLSVYGVFIEPDTKIKEVNYSCFGRMG